MKKDIKKLSSNELSAIKSEMSIEFERVRVDLIKLYDYWVSLDLKYNEIHNELNKRQGITNE